MGLGEMLYVKKVFGVDSLLGLGISVTDSPRVVELLRFSLGFMVRVRTRPET